ncbi:xylulokinase [Corynebacterium pacaense]|uniref:xylulokinase n=1 Tax=Corynebacterium pacaense TaxID=1816684 RepID=UPI0009B94D01|nr:xylulokinase [Corynebacterium pacaense]
MSLVLGVDSSTQSCKALLVDAETGEIVDRGRAAHPWGTRIDPRVWVEAMEEATAGLIDRADAISIAGQQHGMVVVDDRGEVVRDAMLWHDTSSAPEARELISELGGAQECISRTGSLMVASFTGAKLRWLRNHEPENAARVSAVMLPHDYLTWSITGRGRMVTDHGDASGTGYYDPRAREFRPELAELYLGHPLRLPELAAPAEIVGSTAAGIPVAAGTGDNMAAALGLQLGSGDVCVSIGTSGVASAVVAEPVADPTGLVAGFCDASGRYLPLACTLNGARVLDFAATLLGVDHGRLSDLALSGTPGSNGVVMLPYLAGERTPNRPDATGVISGLTGETSREDIARAVVEGVLSSLSDAVDAVESATGVVTGRIIFIGGATNNEAVRAIAPSIFGVDVVIPEAGEYVALGAARQAAWALAGGGDPPAWNPVPSSTLPAGRRGTAVAGYTRLRNDTAGW